MASNADPVQIPATSLAHGSQAPTTVIVQKSSGKSLPPSGNAAAASAAEQAAASARSRAAADKPDLKAQVALLNKYLNDSGRPDEYRVDPSSDAKLIQQINPATGAVVGEFSAAEFPALARSVGVTGALIDSHV
jgi:hypothetical protein